MAARKMEAFAEDATSLAIGELTVENGLDRIAIYGSLNLARDAESLALARDLKAVVDSIVDVLSKSGELPERARPPDEPPVVKNPFV